MNNGSYLLTQLLFVSVRIDFFAPLDENVSDRQLFNDVERGDLIRHVKSSSVVEKQSNNFFSLGLFH